MTIVFHTAELKNQGGDVVAQIEVEADVVQYGERLELEGLTANDVIISGPWDSDRNEFEALIWDIVQRDLDKDLDLQADALAAIRDEAA